MTEQWNNSDSGSNSSDNNEKQPSQFHDGSNKNCHWCGKKGHLAPDCPERETRKKSNWCMCKAVSAHQLKGNDDNNDGGNKQCCQQVKTENEEKTKTEDKKVKWTKSGQGFGP